MYKVFIGTDPTQNLATEVLKYSIKRRSKSEFEFIELKDIPLNLKTKMFTGFSIYRYYIPEACGYQGRALYLDSDIVVLTDVKQLYDVDLAGKGASARPCPELKGWYTSVMVMDCAKLTNWKLNQWVTLINAGMADYKGIMAASPTGLNHRDFGDLPEYWNHLDHYDETTKIIHYTKIGSQPWKTPGHPFAHVFLKELKSAVDAGAISNEMIQKEINDKHVYPNILEDLKKL